MSEQTMSEQTMNEQEIAVKQKHELRANGEQTVAGTFYSPHTDIYETEAGLSMVLDMPGVEKDNVAIQLENDILTIEGKIDYSNYHDLQARYTEYNVGHFNRRFSLSSKIDQNGIRAEMKNGVLTLSLPKVAEAAPRKIEVTVA